MIEYFLLFFGPGALFAYLFFAFGESFLTYQFDPKYYAFGKGKTFPVNPTKLSLFRETQKHQAENSSTLIRLPLQFVFYRLIISENQGIAKKPVFHWIGQIFILFTTLLFLYHGHQEKSLHFFLGAEFIIGGFHLQCNLKLKQVLEELSV